MRSIVETTLPAPTGRMPDQAPPTDPLDEEAASPEEQEFYDTFMNKALEYIHGPKSSRQVLKHMNQPDLSVQEAVGRTTAMIAKNIVESAKMAKVKVIPEAVFNAGQEIVEELFELGSRARVFPIEWPTEDGEDNLTPEQQKLAQDAYAHAAQYYGQELLQSPDAESLKAEAQDEVLRQVQDEVKAGKASPDFMVTDGSSVEGGVKRALISSNGGRMPHGAA
jgi:hypothetical protein